MRVRKWRWVVKKDQCFIRVFVGPKKPRQNTFNGYWHNESSFRDICIHNFAVVFGFLPPVNKPVKVEFTAKLLSK